MLSKPAKGLLIKLGIVGAVLAAIGLLALRGVDVKGLVETGVAYVQAAGPWIFFGAMALLPAAGFPMSVFYFSAGPAFGVALGLPAALAALTVNLALTWWLARHGVRPAIEWLIRRTNYRIPQAHPDNYVRLAFFVRVTPGPPFFVQGYILGLAGVPFGIYMLVSLAVQGSFAVGFVVFGKALMEGQAGLAFFAVSAIVGGFLGVQMLRKRYARKNATQPELV